MEHDSGKLYIMAPGDVYLGARTEESTPVLTSQSIVIVALPDPLPATLPASALSTTAIPFAWNVIHRGFDFDDEGRLYAYGFMYGDSYIARFDGPEWETIHLTLTNRCKQIFNHCYQPHLMSDTPQTWLLQESTRWSLVRMARSMLVEVSSRSTTNQ